MSAVREDIYCGTSALAPELRYPLNDATTTQHADVFARRQRRPTAVLPSEPRRDVVLQVGRQTVQLAYSESGNRLPSWVLTVLRSLAERWGTEPGWDSYDAKPTDPQHAVRLLNYLCVLLNDSSTPPVITPLSDGGLQAEWHRNNQDLEIVVPADEPERYYYYNATTREEEEQELGPQQAHVRDLISNF